jgi:hypothetical protein
VLDLFAVRCGVVFGGFLSVVLSLQVIAVRDVRVMASLLVLARLVVLSRNTMVLRSVLMVFCCFMMVFDTFVRHRNPRDRDWEPANTDT